MLATERVLKFPLTEIVTPCLSTFFRAGDWGQCLELVSHLSQHGDKVLFVTGPTGIGKTSMKYALSKRQFFNLELIDDAHNLSLDNVSTLLDIKDRQVVLFGLPELLTRINSSTLEEDFANRVRIIEIEPLTFPETKSFLAHLWRNMGKDGKLPCKNTELHKIFTISKGIPGKVKQLFSDQLRGSKVLNNETDKKILSPFVVGSAVALAVIVCILAMMWPSQDTEILKPTLPLQKKTLVTQIKVEDPPPIDRPYDDAQVLYEEKLVELENKMRALQEDVPQESKYPPFAKKVAPHPDRAKLRLHKREVRGESSILAMNKGHYSLQLLAASNEDNVRNFIAQHNLIGKAHYYEGTRQGKPWYTVIYGDFNTKLDAQSAIKSLPTALQKLGPWARQYIHIQAAIEQNSIHE